MRLTHPTACVSSSYGREPATTALEASGRTPATRPARWLPEGAGYRVVNVIHDGVILDVPTDENLPQRVAGKSHR